MIDANIYNKKSPKFYVKNYLEKNKDEIKGKCIVDFPAGNGVTSELLIQMEANVLAFDLFPQYFLLDQIKCKQANIDTGIPLENETADMVICQEGIEHFSNPLKALQEFNRILKKNGKLLITTPSYSNLAAKFSYLFFESETLKQMPPNEWDDVWMSDKKNFYFGHLFLIGLQKLRTLSSISGFEIKEARYMRLSKSSLFVFPFFYPLILLNTYLVYFKKKLNLKNHPKKDYILSIYREQLLLNILPKHLLNKHIFLILKKKYNLSEVYLGNEENYKPFQQIM